MINRAAIILRYKEPFIKWINATDSYSKNRMTSEEANDDATVYLVSEDDGENIERWIARNYKTLFESELEDWCLDESLWPKKRDKKMFDAWYDVQCHTMIIDTVDDLIEDDEF